MLRNLAKSLALAVSVAALYALASPAAAVSETSVRTLTGSRALETQVLGQMNRVRAKHGLRPLRFSNRLRAAAALHSTQMGQRGFFSHDSVDGSAFWHRVKRYYGASGYRFWAVGENLLWSSPGVDAQRAVQMWMNSPPHRKNLLSARWREVGLASVHVSNAPGVYGGREVTIVTADFGVRR